MRMPLTLGGQQVTTQKEAHGIFWRYNSTAPERGRIRGTLDSLRSSVQDPFDVLPYVRVEDAFTRYRQMDHQVHDCRVEVDGKLFLVSAYYDDSLPVNSAVKRDFKHFSDWRGEISVIYLGRRRVFRKTASSTSAERAVGA